MSAHTTDAPVVDRYTRPEDLPEWLDLREVAAWRGVSEWLVRQEIRRGNLLAVKMGRFWRVSRESLTMQK